MPVLRQQFLKSTPGSTGARIVPSKFFQEFLVAIDNPETALDVRFGWESFAALATALERRIG
jgi:hypothetical protein